MPLNKDSKYEAGKRYWCGYWQKWYDVLKSEYDAAYPWRLKSVTVQWENGEVGTHQTQLDYRYEYELVTQKRKECSRWISFAKKYIAEERQV